MKTAIRFVPAILIACGAAFAPAFSAPSSVAVDGKMIFPESLGSTANGTLYIGSLTKGAVYRSSPGAAKAEMWIPNSVIGMPMVLGVLTDEASDTLYICADRDDNSASTLETFSLASGKPKARYPFPGGGFCNDIALHDGAVYATDSAKGRILRLARGAKALAVWYDNPSDPSLDGIVWARDGKLYTNGYDSNHLIRIDVKADGSAGKGVILKTDKPIFQPDGMRLTSDGRILMIEGQGRPGAGLKEGRLDEVIPNGDGAAIKVLKSGFELPAAVTPVGNTAWVLEAKLDYQRNADLKNKDPGVFRAYAVPLK